MSAAIETTLAGHVVLTPRECLDGDAACDFMDEVYALKGWALSLPTGLNMSWALNALVSAEGWAERRPDKARELRAEACAMLAYRLR